QDVAPLTTLLARTGELAGAAAPGGVFTTVFSVVKASADTVYIAPEIDAPAGWAIVLGNSPFQLSPRQSDTWVIGVTIPTRTTAGTYAIQVRLRDTRVSSRGGPSDSIV